MSDGQSHAERLVRVTPSAADAPREQDDMTQAWKWPVPPKVRADAFAPVFQPIRDPGEQQAEERQRARDHEIAMARVENEAALVEARVRLAAAWLPDAVGVTVAAAAAGGALLGALFSWAVLR